MLLNDTFFFLFFFLQIVVTFNVVGRQREERLTLITLFTAAVNSCSLASLS